MCQHNPADHLPYLRLIRICYRYALLSAREMAGVPLDLVELDQLFKLRAMLETSDVDGEVELDEGEAPVAERRKHRRKGSQIPATIKFKRFDIPATVSDISGGGLLLQSSEELEVGTRVQVSFGMAGARRYVFTCEVVRVDGIDRYGLRFCGAPLAMRYGSYGRREVRRSLLLATAAG